MRRREGGASPIQDSAQEGLPMNNIVYLVGVVVIVLVILSFLGLR